MDYLPYTPKPGETLFYPFGEGKTRYIAAGHLDVPVWPLAVPWLLAGGVSAG
jgi:hypothetical protein